MSKKQLVWWLAALLPAIAAIAIASLSSQDFRASGAMTLFALTLAMLLILLIIHWPWRSAMAKRKIAGVAGTFVLSVMFAFTAIGGTPEYLKAQFGWFIEISDYGPRAIITGPEGYVIVGDDANSNAVAWTSKDGVGWLRVHDQEAFERLDVGGGFHLSGVYVLIAHDDRRGPVITLVSEDGLEWTRSGKSTTDGKPTRAATNGELFAVVGESFSNDGLFLYGNDPMQLTVAEPAPHIDTDKVPIDVETHDSGFLAIVNHKSDAAVFVSTNGDNWTEVVRFEDTRFTSFTRFNDGYIAAGQNLDTGEPAMWISAEGTAWAPTQLPADTRGVKLDLITGHQSTLMLIGHRSENNESLLWWSDTGVEWEAMDSPFGDAVIRDATIDGSIVIVTGIDRMLDSSAIWVGSRSEGLSRVPHDEYLFSVK